MGGTHHVKVPNQRPLKTGTLLGGVLKPVATHHKLTVEVMAKVTLNGKEFETLWMPPFALDVTDVVKTGDNKLKVLVTSTSKGKPKLGDVKLRTVPRQSAK